MLRAMITPLTLYQIDDSIFDDFQLPTRPFTDRGYNGLYLTGWDIDKDILIDNLLMETAELNVLYTDPEFFKFAVKQWSSKELPVWQSLFETMFFKYNPIWNKDGSLKHSETETRNLLRGLTRSGTNGETVTDTDSRTDSRTTSRTNSRNIDETIDRDEVSNRDYTEALTGTDTDTLQKNTQTETETKVAAYESATYQNRDKVNEANTGTDTNTTTHNTLKTVNDDLTLHTDDTTRDYNETGSESGNESGTESGTRQISTSGTDSATESNSDTGTIQHYAEDVEQGNIGVTMTQQLIEAERNLVQFNIIDYIIDSFKARFCVLVY